MTRAAKYDIATGLVLGVREADPLPALPDGVAYLLLAAEQPCHPHTHKVVDGELVERATPPAEALDELRARRKREAKAHRDAIIALGCATPLGHLQTPPASLVNFNGLVSMASIAKAAGQPFEQLVRMADDSMVAHDAGEMIALGLAVGRHVADCSAAYFAIADAINASDDPAGVDIHIGYPFSMPAS